MFDNSHNFVFLFHLYIKINMVAAANPERTRLSLWLQATRPFSFSASVMPVLIAGAYTFTYYHSKIEWFLFPVLLICAVLFHMGANLVSDYFDYKKNVDRPETFGSSRVIVDGLMTPGEILRGGVLCFIFGTILGLILIYFNGLPILALGAAGFAGGFFYTAKPIGLKYMALGDVIIFLMFAPILMLGAFLGLTGTWNYQVMLASFPIGFLVVAIVHANNARDIMHDSQANIRTFPILTGIEGAKYQYYFLLIGSYLITGILILAGIVPIFTLLTLLTVPTAVTNMKLMSKAEVEKPEIIFNLDVKTAQFHMQFGLLFTIGLALGAIL
ncbi:MAG: 1,4-dihydroxy-2-naphthoate polyprenyltransferase [Bacteroidota bacterium]|nr:1,4-dihydroxy-2-naphthoate polyprenyltransferase [Bacteroidota bacterium]